METGHSFLRSLPNSQETENRFRLVSAKIRILKTVSSVLCRLCRKLKTVSVRTAAETENRFLRLLPTLPETETVSVCTTAETESRFRHSLPTSQETENRFRLYNNGN
jgi:hypothetical protein